MRMMDRLCADLPGAGPSLVADFHDRLGSSNVRYVLDRSASASCRSLLRTAEHLFDPGNDLFRMPAQSFWFEAYQDLEADSSDCEIDKLGVLVTCDVEGRSGEIDHFIQHQSGACARLPVRTMFDLDRLPSRSGGQAFHCNHPTYSHLNTLLAHTSTLPDADALRNYIAEPQALARFRRYIAEATWFDLPMVLAFLAMLNSPDIVEIAPSNLGKLNRARVRRGRMPLLDHVEVRMVLGQSKSRDPTGESSTRRAAPRLHFVRGHFMHCSGKKVWRSSHLRGDESRAQVSRVINVTAPQRIGVKQSERRASL